MKENNKGNSLKTILIILLIILISIISFVGIYVKDANKMKDIMPEYILGSDLKGYRILKIKLDDSTKDIIKDSEGKIIESATDEEIQNNGYTKTTEPVNKEEDKTRDNYLKTRRIIQKRLEELQVSDYRVRQDLEDGSIIVEIKEDTRTDLVISNLLSKGKFEIQNNDTKEVLLSKENVKTAKVLYSATETGTSIYLSIEFDKEGTKKLEEISKEYVSSTDSEGNTTEKKINLLIDDESILTTSFSSPIIDGKLPLSVGSSSSSADNLNDNIGQAQNMAVVLNNEQIPLKYTTESNRYAQASFDKEVAKIALIVLAVILAIMMLVLIIKFKAKGLLAVISHIGFNAILLLLVRMWNVEMGIGGLISLVVVQIINYILLVMMLKEESKKAIVKFAFRIIPAYIISIVFVFMNFLPIYSFGMVIFWGITTAFIYNAIVTRNLIENNK